MDDDTLWQLVRYAWNEETPGGLRPALEELTRRVIVLQGQVDSLMERTQPLDLRGHDV